MNLGRHQLRLLDEALAERDRDLLHVLAEHRYATTRQLARLQRVRYASEASALRQTSRALQRLNTLGLSTHLDRRIGGVRGGSATLVWTLTATGHRVVHYGHHGRTAPTSRYRLRDVSTMFLEHTLAVAELRVQLTELEQAGQLRITRVQTEPDCWRRVLEPGGQARFLRPDLFVTLRVGAYDDAWFLEADCDTESPAEVIQKCYRYQRYQATGSEQATLGVFPAVCWVVPTLKRSEQLRRYLDANPGLDSRVFTVCTVSEFASRMTSGPTPKTNPNPKGGGL
jgi:hypothetical protein